MKGADHYQVERPEWAGRILPVAELPTGKMVSGNKAKVYNVLLLARESQHRFRVGRQLAPAGWVPTWVLREVWCGGSAGDRRLRDLREAAVVIESMVFDGGTEETQGTYLWRLGDGVSQPASTSRAAQSRGGVLARLRFTTHLGRPTLWSGTLIDVTPGASSWLAPSGDVELRVVKHELDVESATELYRKELLGRFHAGQVIGELAGLADAAFFARADSAFNPLPFLITALTRLGAVHQEVR